MLWIQGFRSYSFFVHIAVVSLLFGWWTVSAKQDINKIFGSFTISWIRATMQVFPCHGRTFCRSFPTLWKFRNGFYSISQDENSCRKLFPFNPQMCSIRTGDAYDGIPICLPVITTVLLPKLSSLNLHLFQSWISISWNTETETVFYWSRIKRYLAYGIQNKFQIFGHNNYTTWQEIISDPVRYQRDDKSCGFHILYSGMSKFSITLI